MSREYTLSFGAANAYAIVLVIPIIAILIFPYIWIHGWETFAIDIFHFFINIPLLIVSIIVGTLAHEYIHAISWWLLDDIPWDKIHFGFKWKTLTPYVHCPEHIEVSNYRWSVAMPGIVLGIIPYLLALFLQNGWLLGFGLFFAIAAVGDLLILWLLRGVEKGKKVQDHSEKIGCKIVD